MEIQEKHRLEILNAKCNYVCAVDILQKKMSYGEDVSCCINKLYLAQKLIGRLECFCFETPVVETEVLSVFELISPENNFLTDTIVQLSVNDIQVYSYTTVGAEYKPTIASNILTSLGYDFTTSSGGKFTTFTVDFECNVTSVAYSITKSGETNTTNLTNTIIGACATSNPPCYNCIENSDLPKMYEVLHKLLS